MMRPATWGAALCLGAVLAACGQTAQIVPGGGPPDQELMPRPYMHFTVIVPKGDGALEPAKAEADQKCGQVLQSAVMYAASDVGSDRRQFFFRCQ